MKKLCVLLSLLLAWSVPVSAGVLNSRATSVERLVTDGDGVVLVVEFTLPAADRVGRVARGMLEFETPCAAEDEASIWLHALGEAPTTLSRSWWTSTRDEIERGGIWEGEKLPQGPAVVQINMTRAVRAALADGKSTVTVLIRTVDGTCSDVSATNLADRFQLQMIYRDR
ncbi:MAG: hypothetical protein DRH76_03575 [Deltaproteobacteria bacterium]|nr:MAG: hypothetical protein DRH76_03575 [Deltaproteobacteria bacterium]